MLDFQRMTRCNRQRTALAVACLLVIPQTLLWSSTLRDEATSYREQGYELQERGDLSGALSFYQKAAALDPTFPTPWNDAGVLLEQSGKLKEAEDAYQQALTIDANYLPAHGNLAMLYERLGDREKAIYHWLKRYQLGTADDPWTARAEQRLAALGVLQAYPSLKGKIFTRRKIVGDEFDAHEQSLQDFQDVTEQQGRWP